jgi:DNA-binding NtrC family response regulator
MLQHFLASKPQRPALSLSQPGSAANDIVPLLVGYTVEELERELILQTLAYQQGNRTEAAALLGLSIRTLRNRLKDYAASGIAIPQPGHQGFPLARV